MKPSQAEQDAPLSLTDMVTLADAVALELTGDSSQLLPWLARLSEVQKQQLWAALPPDMRSQLQRLSQEPQCAPA